MSEKEWNIDGIVVKLSECCCETVPSEDIVRSLVQGLLRERRKCELCKESFPVKVARITHQVAPPKPPEWCVYDSGYGGSISLDLAMGLPDRIELHPKCLAKHFPDWVGLPALKERLGMQGIKI